MASETVAVFAQDAAEEQVGVGIARIGGEDFVQDANGLWAVALGEQIPGSFHRGTLREQQEGASGRGQKTPHQHSP